MFAISNWWSDHVGTSRDAYIGYTDFIFF